MLQELATRKGVRPTALDANQRQLLIALDEQQKTPSNTLCEMIGTPKPTLTAYEMILEEFDMS